MNATLAPLPVLLLTLAGWVNRHQQHLIEYVVEENRVLKEVLAGLSFAKTPSSRQVVDLSEKSKPDRLGPLWIHCKTCPPLPGPGRLGRRPVGKPA